MCIVLVKTMFLSSCTHAYVVLLLYYIFTFLKTSQMNLIRYKTHTHTIIFKKHLLILFLFYSESAEREKLDKELSLCNEIYFIYSLLTLNLLASCITRLMLMLLENTHNKSTENASSVHPALTFKSPQKLEVCFGHSAIKNN